jgi:ubiquinone/menaquinone biosynthesis C-methylase UbiE
MRGNVTPIVIPEAVHRAALEELGGYFTKISLLSPELMAADHLDPGKAAIAARQLEQFVSLRGKKVLEIGSGFGVNLAEWIRHFDIDGYGVEPSSLGFDASFRASQILFTANGLDKARIIDATGEALPFDDRSFDIVYSANVLEHVGNPEKVLEEAMRVVKPGGFLHMEFPNYTSYYESHYSVLQPPMISKKWLARWVRLFGRSPDFVETLNLLNPVWCRRAVRRLSAKYPLTLLSLGEETFLAKLARSYEFRTMISANRMSSVLRVLQAVNLGNWLGHTIVALQGHYPILLTIRREAAPLSAGAKGSA